MEGGRAEREGEGDRGVAAGEMKGERREGGGGVEAVISAGGGGVLLDHLPDDVLVCIMTKLAARASSPADVISASMTCRRLRAVFSEPRVLQTFGVNALHVRARQFCPHSHAYLRKVARGGNLEAQCLLGMIEFYCLDTWQEGIRLLSAAASKGHAQALYALAIVNFNGSGLMATERNLQIGVLLAAVAAQEGHVEALRELGHCLQDGYGVRRHVAEGRRLLLEANVREFAQRSGGGGAERAGKLPMAAAEVVAQLQEGMRRVELGCSGRQCGRREGGREGGRALGQVHPTEGRLPRMSAPGAGGGEGEGEGEGEDEGEGEREGGGVVTTRGDGSTSSSSPPPPSSGEEREGGGGIHGSICPGRSSTQLAQILHSLSHCLGPLASSYGGAAAEEPVALWNRFLLEWFRGEGSKRLKPGLKLCGNLKCGRPETQPHEFRCCAVCSVPSYCSRACQARDWKSGHILVCREAMGVQGQERRGGREERERERHYHYNGRPQNGEEAR